MASEEVILGQVERVPVGHLHCARRMFVLPQGSIPFLLIPWIGNKQTLGIMVFPRFRMNLYQRMMPLMACEMRLNLIRSQEDITSQVMS